MATITITLDVDDDLDAKLAKARAVVRLLEEAKAFIVELAGDAAGISEPSTASGVRQTPARPTADRPPPRAVVETNGHGPKPKRHRGPLTSPARARRYSAEEKAGAVARVAEVGLRAAAAEVGALPSSVQRWIGAHPKEHAAGRINGTPPAVGESREDWEARKREAAGSSL